MSAEAIRKELERLRALAEKATPGPWFNGYWSGRCHMSHIHGIGNCNYQYQQNLAGEFEHAKEYVSSGATENMEICNKLHHGTAAFIAESRTAIPRLLACVEKLLEGLEQAKSGVAPYASSHIWAEKAIAEAAKILEGK